MIIKWDSPIGDWGEAIEIIIGIMIVYYDDIFKNLLLTFV